MKHVRSVSQSNNTVKNLIEYSFIIILFFRSLKVFFNLLHADASDEIQALAPEMSSLFASFSSDITLNAKLFEKIKTVYDVELSSLNGEEKKLLENTYKSFQRNGALLDSKKQERLREIDQESAKLSPEFSQRVIKATAAFELHVTSEEDVAPLPSSAKSSAKELAEEHGKKGWIFNLEMPSYVPFITYCPNQELREKMWRAYTSRCLGGEYDTSEIINKIVQLRHERARLLGYDTHADYVLEERMAKSKDKVMDFLDDLIEASLPAAQKDLDSLLRFAKEIDGVSELKPWDVSFYQEKLRERDYELKEEDIRPYFPLGKCVQGAFDLATRLYGISFKKREDIPTYHKDVETYEITDVKTGDYVGLFYTDFFPRATKKTGAWMTSYREQGLFKGEIRRPHVSIVCNFSKPSKDHPSLLTFREVETLFHEFGHALHGILSDCKYRSLAGTSVFWDFVELPSQFMENFLMEKEVLDTFAEHYETGEKIPDALFQKMKKADKFMKGYMSLRQLNFGMLDMAWHYEDPGHVDDIEAFEAKATERTSLLPHQKGSAISAAFAHIFGGGYSAGYYSYKWAEVLDADAFEYFKENGLFDESVSQKFREHILSKGGTDDPLEMYKRFRGREPDVQALLRRDGLVPARTQ